MSKQYVLVLLAMGALCPAWNAAGEDGAAFGSSEYNSPLDDGESRHKTWLTGMRQFASMRLFMESLPSWPRREVIESLRYRGEDAEGFLAAFEARLAIVLHDKWIPQDLSARAIALRKGVYRVCATETRHDFKVRLLPFDGFIAQYSIDGVDFYIKECKAAVAVLIVPPKERLAQDFQTLFNSFLMPTVAARKEHTNRLNGATILQRVTSDPATLSYARYATGIAFEMAVNMDEKHWPKHVKLAYGSHVTFEQMTRRFGLETKPSAFIPQGAGNDGHILLTKAEWDRTERQLSSEIRRKFPRNQIKAVRLLNLDAISGAVLLEITSSASTKIRNDIRKNDYLEKAADDGAEISDDELKWLFDYSENLETDLQHFASRAVRLLSAGSEARKFGLRAVKKSILPTGEPVVVIEVDELK